MKIRKKTKKVKRKILGNNVVKKVKLNYIAIGVAAYYGIRYLSKRGILSGKSGTVVDTVTGTTAGKSVGTHMDTVDETLNSVSEPRKGKVKDDPTKTPYPSH